MAGVRMACTNKGKTAPGDGADSDSVAIDSLMAEADTTRLLMKYCPMLPVFMASL